MTTQSPGGYTGKILRVNLSNRNISVDEQDEKFYRRYMGGTALIAYYLLKEVKPGTEPFSPENKLIIAGGVLTGLPFAGSGRTSVGSKSPLTNAWGDAQGGGFFPAELKRAGWDAIIVEGKAASPVYIWINDDKVEIRDASHLWGKDTLTVERQIQSELGDSHIRTCQIGPAGEKLVRFACVLNDVTHAHGRNGHGAVMGSKNLRAIAVRGSKSPAMAHPEKVREVAKWMAENYKTLAGGMYDYGTPGVLAPLQASGILPTRNFNFGQIDNFEELSGPRMAETILVGRGNCYSCPIHCKREVKVGPPYNVDPAYGGPEYETLASLGSLCGITNLKAVAKGAQMCNAYGLDTIATGVSIAFAMECFENGLLTREDTGGLDLRFGNEEAMLATIDLINERKGLGNILAEGTKRAAETIGNGAEKFAMQIKGQELPMHDPRGKVALGLGYAVSPTGADHCHNLHDTAFAAEGPGLDGQKVLGILEPLSPLDLGPEKVRMYHYTTIWKHFLNCGVVCMFVPFKYEQYVDLVNGATGWNTSVWELWKVGERALAMMRLFNAREGYTAKDDVIPDRLYKAFKTGPLADIPILKKTMKEAITTYYQMAGWDAKMAAPTAGKLAELDLSWLIPDLENAARK